VRTTVAPRLRGARRAVAVVGLITALIGVGLDDRRVTWIAIGLLGVAAVLRLIAGSPRVRRLRRTKGHS